MKTCTICKETKDETEFNRKGTGFQNKCRGCSKLLAKKHYAANKNYYVAKNTRLKKQTHRMYKELKLKLKCVRCGMNEPSCLDFHHRDAAKKDFNIAAAFGWGYGWKRIQEEIDKCVTLCANCHRMLHAGVIEL